MERSSGAVKSAYDIQVDDRQGPGRPKMTWKNLTEKGRLEWKLTTVNPPERASGDQVQDLLCMLL